MRTKIAAALALAFITACGSPNDIILGPEPLKQMAEQGDKFKRLSEEDRTLLAGYLALTEMAKTMGANPKPTTGRTVGEVMVDARAWKEDVKAAEIANKKREAEAETLRLKIEAEKKAVSEKIQGMVTIAVINKVVLPKNYNVGRYSELLMIQYALENKSQKTIKQIKGVVSFVDATGDPVGSLGVDFDTPIKAGATVNTDTGSGWKTNSFSNGNIEKIANHDFSSMKGKFTPLSIAFADGEVLRASE